MFKRLIASILCLTFSISNLQSVHAQDFSVNQLPVPGTMVGESVPFSPLSLKGLIVNPQKPLEFQFIVDTGKGPQDTASIKEETRQLVKYFLAGLTIPEGDLWVNLSPYEKNRMVPEALGQTDLGRDLLAQDYILKQLTASLIYPQKDLGKAFWSRVYAKAQQQFGTTNVPVNTFNKVWILPDQAQVYENGSAAYVTKATLKVMLDEDYRALSKHTDVGAGSKPAQFRDGLEPSPTDKNLHSIASQIVRQIILPEITKEVNAGKNFAPLRQIYQSLILAKWYKETIQNGLLDALYTNKSKVAGVNLNDPTVKEKIYNRYLQAYKKGAFNYIKEDPTPDGQVVPRKYFSGGFTVLNMKVGRTRAPAMLSKALTLVAGSLMLFLVSCDKSNGGHNKPEQIQTNQPPQVQVPQLTNPEIQSSTNKIDVSGSDIPKTILIPPYWKDDSNYFLGDVDKVFVDRGLQVEVIGGDYDINVGADGFTTTVFKSTYRLKNVGNKPISLVDVFSQYNDGNQRISGSSTSYIPKGSTTNAPWILQPGKTWDINPLCNLPPLLKPTQVYIIVNRGDEAESHFSFVAIDRLRDADHLKKYYNDKAMSHSPTKPNAAMFGWFRKKSDNHGGLSVNQKLVMFSGSGDTETVARLISAGADVNTKQGDWGYNPLTQASGEGFTGIVELLLDSGADVNIRRTDGYTPLMAASYGGHEDVVELLLKSGADINLRDINGQTALSIARREKKQRIADILIARGAESSAMLGKLNFKKIISPLVHLPTPSYQTLLLLNLLVASILAPRPATAQNVSSPATETAVENNHQLNVEDLVAAALYGDPTKVQAVLNSNIDINGNSSKGINAVSAASALGHMDVLKLLIAKGADLNAKNFDGSTALMVAADTGRKNIVEFLLAHGADVNLRESGDETALIKAVSYGSRDIAELLLAKGADVNAITKEGATALMIASQDGHMDVVDLLLSKGADVNAKNSDGRTALIQASQDGHKNVVDLLLSKGADINAKDNNEVTSLYLACQNGHENVVELLVSKGADVNTQMNDGSSALKVASQNGYIQVVNFLLSKGANVEIRDNNDGTPLMEAALSGHSDIVSILLSHGADINVKDKHNMTVLLFVTLKGNKDMVSLLLSKGADVNAQAINGATVLITACMQPGLKDQEDIVRLLLAKGADVNLTAQDGVTALMVAASMEQTISTNEGEQVKDGRDIVPLLISKGAKVNAKAINGQTALSMAKMMSHTEIVKMLEDAGAKDNAMRGLSNSQILNWLASIKSIFKSFSHRLINNSKIVRITPKIVYLLALMEINQTLINPALAQTQLGAARIIEAANQQAINDMVVAAAHGDLSTVKKALDSKIDINAMHSMGFTSLMAASIVGNKEMVKFLLDHGADVNAKSTDGGATALVGAAAKGNKEIVELLLAKGADINAKDDEGKTALLMAAFGGYADLVSFLLEKGADLSVKTTDGATVLMAAIQNNHKDIVSQLIAKGADVNDKDNKGRTILVGAVNEGNFDIVSLLLSKGAAVNSMDSDGRPALTWASQQQRLDIIQLLITNGADVNIKDDRGVTALSVASQDGGTNVVQLLLTKGADVNSKDFEGSTPLIVASQHGHPEVVALLLANGADVNVKFKSNRTALMQASQDGHNEVVEQLLAKGADMNAQDDEGLSALMTAAFFGYGNVVESLLSKGADVDLKNNMGVTALMAASQNGYKDIVAQLLAKGADINAKAANGATPLILASFKGNKEIVQLLLSKGADFNVKTTDGVTALSAARIEHFPEIVDVLTAAGAKDQAMSHSPKKVAVLTGELGDLEKGVNAILNGVGMTGKWIRVNIKPATDEDKSSREWNSAGRYKLTITEDHGIDARVATNFNVAQLLDEITQSPILVKRVNNMKKIASSSAWKELKEMKIENAAMISLSAFLAFPISQIKISEWYQNLSLLQQLALWAVAGGTVFLAGTVYFNRYKMYPTSKLLKLLKSAQDKNDYEGYNAASDELHKRKRPEGNRRWKEEKEMVDVQSHMIDFPDGRPQYSGTGKWDLEIRKDAIKEKNRAMSHAPNAAMKKNLLAENGGIDLNQINVLRNGKKVNVHFDPAQLTQLEQGGFAGFSFKIESMTRISSPFQLLGVQLPSKQVMQLAKA